MNSNLTAGQQGRSQEFDKEGQIRGLWGGSISVGAQSILGGHDIFARKKNMHE